jgi:hypothetical protein
MSRADGGCATAFCLPDVHVGRDAGNTTRKDGGHDARHAWDAAHHDASSDAGKHVPDAKSDARDAAVCTPVSTVTLELSDGGGTCPVPDASCYPQPVAPSQLAWVPPHAPESACTATELASIGSTSDPSLSSRCASCFFSTTNENEYAAEVDFPQVTFVGYGFANVAGCIATLEPCNQPCASLVLGSTLCPSEACLPSCHPTSPQTYTEMLPCLSSAQNGCPCGAITTAANECVNEILARNSPAAACFPPQVAGQTQQEAYYALLEVITRVLCGVGAGSVDGGKADGGG